MAKLFIFSHGFPLGRADLKNDPPTHPDEVVHFGFLVFTHSLDQIRLGVVPHFFLWDSRASETRARVKITPREKDDKKDKVSPRRVSPSLAWDNFHARSLSLALPSLRTNGGLLVV